MPNKDSFTFSDKLRKSKSLPLSKRIPSKIGGDGKAKRTLIQRAQRDLPFIIVAAAALLLLPILSRDSGSEYDGQVQGGYADFVPEDGSATGAFDRGLGGESDLSPTSGFRDPLSLIKRKSGEDSAGMHNDFDGSNYNYNDDNTKDSGVIPNKITNVYKEDAKRSIRKAIQRKATQIASLRNSKTAASSGGGGVIRNLATGSARQATSGTSVRQGVRPVALQAMTSAGKGGRSMTGEGLYAEAARSLGAMNRGSAKQALFDAQLRNVDGTPLGAAGMGPGFGAGSARNGGGGAPNNKVGYNHKTPWWWDFEKQKLMDKWKNWEGRLDKTLSDITFKIGQGLAYCLLTGSEDGSVKYMLGKKAGDAESICVLPGGKSISAGEYSKQFMSTNKEGDSSGGGDLAGGFDKYCTQMNGKMDISEGGPKNFLQTRSECLGLKLKMGQKRSVADKNNCGGVYGPNKSFKLESNKPGDAEYMGVYILVDTTPKSESTGSGAVKSKVGYIQKGGTWKGGDTLTVAGVEHYITGVVGFTVKGLYKGDNLQNPLNSATSSACKDIEVLQTQYAASLKRNEINISGKDAKYATKEAIDSKKSAESLKIKLDTAIGKCNASKDKSSNTSNLKNSDGSDYKDVRNELSAKVNKQDIDRIKAEIAAGVEVSEAYVQKELHITPAQSCSVPSDFRTTSFGKIDLGETGSTRVTCIGSALPKFTATGAMYDFAAEISNVPGDAVVHAVRVEKAAAGPTEGKFIVRQVYANIKKENNVYLFKGAPAELGNEKADKINGQGFVYWIVTKPDNALVVNTNALIDPKGDERLAAQGFVTVPDFTVGVCEYLWNCNADECNKSEKPDDKQDYCKEDGKVFRANRAGDGFAKTNNDSLEDEAINTAAAAKQGKTVADCKSDMATIAKAFVDNLLNCKKEPEPRREAIQDPISGQSGLNQGDCNVNFAAFFKSGMHNATFTNNKFAASYAIVRDEQYQKLLRCIERERSSVIVNITGYASRDSAAVAQKNQTLSEARAINIANQLIQVLTEKYNLDVPQNIMSSGWGGTDREIQLASVAPTMRVRAKADVLNKTMQSALLINKIETKDSPAVKTRVDELLEAKPVEISGASVSSTSRMLAGDAPNVADTPSNKIDAAATEIANAIKAFYKDTLAVTIEVAGKGDSEAKTRYANEADRAADQRITATVAVNALYNQELAKFIPKYDSFKYYVEPETEAPAAPAVN